MKRCSNPNCDSTFLYGEDKEVCTFCHSELVHNLDNAVIHLQPADRIPGLEPVRNQAVQFIHENLSTMECHGRIVEIDHQELFNSKRLKLINTIFRGEPYQFAHQTIEYTIRVESLSDDYPPEVRDFCLYGSYLGRMQVGDEVQIKAKNLKHRRIVKSIYNRTTDTIVKPGFQIPAILIRIPISILSILLIALMCSIVWMVESGAAAILLTGVLTALIPIIIMIWIFWEIIKGIFRR